MIAITSIVCVTAVIMYGMRLYVSHLDRETGRALHRLRVEYTNTLNRVDSLDNRTADTATKLVDARSDLATVSGRLSDLQQTVKDAQLSRIDRMEQQIQGIHARMGTR